MRPLLSGLAFLIASLATPLAAATLGSACKHGDFVGGSSCTLAVFGGGLIDGISVTANKSSSTITGRAQIYNSGNDGGLDPDLEDPTRVSTNETLAPTNLLIISEGGSTGADPNDRRLGGKITLTSTAGFFLTGATIVADREVPLTFTINGSSVAPTPTTGDDKWLEFLFPDALQRLLVTSLEIDYGRDSGGVALHISPVPLPGGAALMLGGLAGLVLLRGTRRRAGSGTA